MSFQELGQASCPVGSRFGGLCKPAAASGGPQGMALAGGPATLPVLCSAMRDSHLPGSGSSRKTAARHKRQLASEPVLKASVRSSSRLHGVTRINNRRAGTVPHKIRWAGGEPAMGKPRCNR